MKRPTDPEKLEKYLASARERTRRYRDRNRERLREIDRAVKNKLYHEKFKSDPEYKQKAKERAAAYYRMKKETDPAWIDLQRKKTSAFMKANPHIVATNTFKRRMRKEKATPEWLSDQDFQYMKALYLMRNRVSECLGVVHHVDHIVPLKSKKVCGLHVPWNLRVIPASKNMAKGNRLEETMSICNHDPQA